MFRRKDPRLHPLVVAFHDLLGRGAAGFPLGEPDLELGTVDDAGAVIQVVEEISAMDSAGLAAWAGSASRLIEELGADNPKVIKMVLREGIPKLLIIEERLRMLSDTDPAMGDTWITILLSLVRTCTPPGGERLLAAIAEGRMAGHFRWAFIFSALRESSIQREMLFKAYAASLPPEPFPARLLTLGKSLCLKEWNARHPLDHPAAEACFGAWILDPATDESTAIDAAVSLSFLTQPWAAALITAALRHGSAQVRLETAWGLARRGDAAGARALAAAGADFRTGRRALAYLEELGLEKMEPAVCKAPEFLLRASLSEWVEDPDGGFHTPPEEIEIVHQTTGLWPGIQKPCDIFVLKYRVRDRWGARADGVGFGSGVAGGRDCLWVSELSAPHHESYTDMAANGIFNLLSGKNFQELFDEDTDDYLFLLDLWKDEGVLTDPELQRVLVIDPPLTGLPVLIGVVEAERDGVNGWAVIESPPGIGGGNFWYDPSLRPEDFIGDSILREHAGRRFLGWSPHPHESSRVPGDARETIPPETLAANFEKMARSAVTAGEELRYELLPKLDKSLSAYAESLRALQAAPQRFVETASLIAPLLTEEKAMVPLALQMVAFGDLSGAAKLMARVEDQSLHGKFEVQRIRALYAVGQEEMALRGLKNGLVNLAKVFQSGTGPWRRWRVRSATGEYADLRQLLQDLAPEKAGEYFMLWNLPEQLFPASPVK